MLPALVGQVVPDCSAGGLFSTAVPVLQGPVAALVQVLVMARVRVLLVAIIPLVPAVRLAPVVPCIPRVLRRLDLRVRGRALVLHAQV